MKKFLVMICLLLAAKVMSAQCVYLPADCPSDDYVGKDRGADSIDKLNNPVVPQEISMENRLRLLTGDIITKLAAGNNWQAVELDEEFSSGYRLTDGSVLVYGKRPPHWCQFTYEIIVNNDSLLLWRNWLEEFAQRRVQETKEYLTQSNPDREKWMAADKKAESDRKSLTVRFRDASIVAIQFDFNLDIAETSGTMVSANWNIPAAVALARLYNNNEPIFNDPVNTFNRSRNMALLLLGGWNLKPDQYNYYHRAVTDKTSLDKASDKKIKCDRVQNVAIHLSGNKKAMQSCLSVLAGGALQNLVVKE